MINDDMETTWWKVNGRLGFTLLEAVLAMALLGVGLLAIAETFQWGMRIQTAMRERSVALSLAQAKMEETLSKPFHSITNTPIERSLFGQFDRTVDVRDPEAMPHVKWVEVIVAWRSPLGWSVERLDTYAANHNQAGMSRLTEARDGRNRAEHLRARERRRR